MASLRNKKKTVEKPTVLPIDDEDLDDEDDEDLDGFDDENSDGLDDDDVVSGSELSEGYFLATGVIKYGQKVSVRIRDTEHVTFEAGIEYPFVVGDEEAAFEYAKNFVDEKIREDVEYAKQLSAKVKGK